MCRIQHFDGCDLCGFCEEDVDMYNDRDLEYDPIHGAMSYDEYMGECEDETDEPIAHCAACGEPIYAEDDIFFPDDGNDEAYCDLYECREAWVDSHRGAARTLLPCFD